MSSKHLSVPLLLLFFLSSPSSTLAAAPTDFIFAVCSQSKYTPNSPYQLNLYSLLSSLTTSSTSSSYSNSTSSSSSSSLPAYGIFQCRGDISAADCRSCITSSINQLSSICMFATGAVIQLTGCFLQYDNTNFIGKQDTSVLYKKCGGIITGDYNTGFIEMRDSALGELSTGMDNYRVGGAGYVQSMAQCVGDQSTSECNDCVSSAVAQLKSNCGLAVGGDVYLGKCYVKFWSNGNYNPTVQDDNHHDDNSDETGKTIAIIIGVIAALALIVIFLSSLNRRYGSGGKS